MTESEQIAQARRQADLISEEMRSIQGLGVRATVERGGESLIVSSPGGVDIGGFFTVDAKLDEGRTVTVYVPDDLVIPTGAIVYVVAGQHGHYFRSLASEHEP